MLRLATTLLALAVLAVTASDPTTGQTIPPPLHLPIVQGAGTSTVPLVGAYNTAPVLADYAGFHPNVPYPTDAQLTAGVRDCLPSEHDPNQWHGLYDPVKNCYYDHEHKSNPRELDHILGPVGGYLDNKTISYPWQTFSLAHITSWEPGLGRGGNYELPHPTDPRYENDHKHNGYGWGIIREETAPYDSTVECRTQMGKQKNCIVNARIQFHGMANAHDATVRFHSFWMEFKACNKDNPTQCGITRTGGWVDFGMLNLPYKSLCVPLEGDPDPAFNSSPTWDPDACNTGSAEYRAHPRYPSSIVDGSGNKNVLWLNHERFGLRWKDAWGQIDPTDVHTEHFFCPDYQCTQNGSQFKLYFIAFDVPDIGDPDGDGYADYNGWTDRYGNIVTDCTKAGLDCIPFILENAPIGVSVYFDGYQPDRPHPQDALEYDTSPPGQFRIKYPN
jgi:hypothetical protein